MISIPMLLAMIHFDVIFFENRKSTCCFGRSSGSFRRNRFFDGDGIEMVIVFLILIVYRFAVDGV